MPKDAAIRRALDAFQPAGREAACPACKAVHRLSPASTRSTCRRCGAALPKPG